MFNVPEIPKIIISHLHFYNNLFMNPIIQDSDFKVNTVWALSVKHKTSSKDVEHNFQILF